MTAAALGLVLALATPTERSMPPAVPPGGTMIGTMQSLVIGESEPPLSQYPLSPLSQDQLERVTRARGMREAGDFAPARELLLAVLSEAPHHPVALTELVRVEVGRGDWSAVEKLGRTERAFLHDSLLVGRELALAFERTRKHRDAAQIAMECWVVRAAEAEWAFATLTRVAGSDSKGVREVVRRFATQNPDRVDLQTAAARLDWKMGDRDKALRQLIASDRPGLTPPLRWQFADELLQTGAARDSAGAVEALTSMVQDVRFDGSHRILAARRALEVHEARGTSRAAAAELYAALKDLPPRRWQADLLVDIARSLREAGKTNEARELLDAPGLNGRVRQTALLERALNDLRDGPPERALESLEPISETSPEARFRYGEALFFSGRADTALGAYKMVLELPAGTYTGAAFERIYLIEDAQPRSALPAVGRLSYLVWKGDSKTALTLADSLFQALPQGALWAQVGLILSQRLEIAGLYQAALAPMLAVAERLPGDRLAPLALQRAGDLYLNRLKNEPEALAQYEACLTRYPKAWNSAEVRRRLESLRKRRF